MTTHTLSIAFFLLSIAARSQYTIDLAGAGRVDVPPGVHVDSVIACFDSHAAIGTVMKGMTNRSVPAYLGPSVTEAVMAVLHQPAEAPGDQHVFLRLNVLRISERSMGLSELAPCALNFDVLMRDDSGGVRMLFEQAVTLSSSGSDVTKKHARNIHAALADGMLRFAEEARLGRLWDCPVPLRDLYKAPLPLRSGFAILSGRPPERGLYRSYMAMRDQRPDTATAFEVKYLSDSDPRLQEAKLKVVGDTLKDDIWGFSDGKDIYMNMGRRFARLTPEQQGFRTWYPGPNTSNTYVTAGIMFGMIGVLVAKAAEPGNELVPFELDLLTGSMQMAGASNAPGSAESEHVFVYSRHCALDTVVEMTLFGGEEARLIKGSYHNVRLVPRAKLVPLELHIGMWPPIIIELDANTVDDTQVYLIKVNANGGIAVDHLNRQMAQATLSKLDPAKEVK
ncbi:MAG: hypothetical protein QM724_09030 [Flavobacteriales bacterium]